MAQILKKNNTNLVLKGPIERFFTSYAQFEYNPSHPLGTEYRRMSRLYGWKRNDRESSDAWAAYRVALVKEFNHWFGTDEHDLLAWQTLCICIGIRGNISSSDSCCEVLQNQHFNLVDLIDVRRRGHGTAQVFPSEEALQEYTKRTAAYFPHYSPKAGKLLKRLLRRPRKNLADNLGSFPANQLFASRDKEAKSGSAKTKESSQGGKTREARTTKKHRKAANSYPLVEFTSE
ncbi:hypothetical protein MMC11_002154 [Xylographa trunciseda]|nr:hypothetical protein [Xylographa trunciseda]